MSTNHRVVAGVVPVRPRPEVIAWAASEAAARGVALDLVAAGRPTQVAESALGWAASLAAERQPGLVVCHRVVPGSAEQVLGEAAVGADLLVVGADDQSPLMEAISGSVPGALLSSAPCPLVVVPQDAEPVDGTAPVLVGVDTAEISRPALDHGFAAAARAGRPLQVVLCWSGPRDGVERRADRGEQQRALSIALSGYGERYSKVAVAELMVDADPIEELARRSRRAVLLVLGSRGRGRFASLAFGSVSRALIRRSRCPVAVLRPDLPVTTPLAS